MSRYEALLAMQQGKKVAHMYFDEEEYFYIKDGQMFMEDGFRVQTQQYDGWADRSGGAWESGWHIVD